MAKMDLEEIEALKEELDGKYAELEALDDAIEELEAELEDAQEELIAEIED